MTLMILVELLRYPHLLLQQRRQRILISIPDQQIGPLNFHPALLQWLPGVTVQLLQTIALIVAEVLGATLALPALLLQSQNHLVSLPSMYPTAFQGCLLFIVEFQRHGLPHLHVFLCNFKYVVHL